MPCAVVEIDGKLEINAFLYAKSENYVFLMFNFMMLLLGMLCRNNLASDIQKNIAQFSKAHLEFIAGGIK